MKTYPISECKNLSLRCAALVYLYQSPDNKVTIDGDDAGIIQVKDDQGQLIIKGPSNVSKNVIFMENVGTVITGSNQNISIDMNSKKMTIKKPNGTRTFNRVGQVIIGNNGVVYENDVVFNVDNDSVVINMGSSDEVFGKLPKIRIYSPIFPSIQASGSVILQYTNIKQDELDLDISGSCTINLDVVALNSFDLTCSGSSDVDIEGNIQNITVDCSGSSDATLVLASTAIKTKANCSGSSTLILRGSCDTLKAKCSGSSDINAATFKTRNASISASGNSDATLFKPSESLTREARGNSDIDIKVR